MPDRIISQPSNDAYRANGERIWGGPGSECHSHVWDEHGHYPRYDERTCPICREQRGEKVYEAGTFGSFRVHVDPSVPKNTILFVDNRFEEVGRIVNLEVP